MSEAKKRRTSVKVTDELAERLADDAEAGYAARNIQCVQPAGAARVWRRARGHLPPSTPDWMTSSRICSSSAPNVTVSTSPTSFVKRCGPTSSDPGNGQFSGLTQGSRPRQEPKAPREASGSPR